MARAELAAAIWGDVEASKASANLRFVLAGVRRWQKEFGRRMMSISARDVSLDADCEPCDLQRLLGLLPMRPDEIGEAISLYAGDLLAFEALGSNEFGSWLYFQRELLRARFLEAILEAAPAANPDAAERAYRHLLSIDPADERIARRLASHLANQDRAGEAQSLLRSFRHHLRDDLGVWPSAATEALAAQLKLPTSQPNFAPAPRTRQGFPRLMILPPVNRPGTLTPYRRPMLTPS